VTYPTHAINKALGLEAGASLDDAMTTIAQLRASLEDVAELREAVHRLKSERDAARQGVIRHRDRINELCAELKEAAEALEYHQNAAVGLRLALELTPDAPLSAIVDMAEGQTKALTQWGDEARRLRAQLEENERDMARAYQSYQDGAAREAAEYQTIRRELDRAQADNAELRRQVGVLDRNLTETERGRDAAFAALHHATAAYL
jgi:chromosome segregation ATPase